MADKGIVFTDEEKQELCHPPPFSVHFQKAWCDKASDDLHNLCSIILFMFSITFIWVFQINECIFYFKRILKIYKY